ncbi:MAG: permease [Anaerovoracaceae bacterium]
MGKIWDFISEQLLGMKWLNELIGSLLSSLGLDITGKLGGSIQFFLYDVVKILLLLTVLIFIISYIQSYFPPERTKEILGGYKGIFANTIGALLGTLTPFCSCSSIPLFIGFTNAGLPLGVTFSFLISSPLVDLGAFVLLISIFGFKIAVAYVIVGIILAVIGGAIIDKMKMEKYLETFTEEVANGCGCSAEKSTEACGCSADGAEVCCSEVAQKTNCCEQGSDTIDIEAGDLSKKDRAKYGKEQTAAVVKQVFWYVIIGVAIGALIHNWIPEEIIQNVLGDNNPFSVILATIVGIPMYADIFGTLPIAEALYLKGVGIGTVLSFMMAVTALSLPSLIMLRTVVKPKLLAIFIIIITIGIIAIGYLFNAVAFIFI